MEDRNSEDEIGNDTVDIAMKFLSGGIVVTIYIIGFYLHTRLIKFTKKDKDMCWMMIITNSLFILGHFAHTIIMYALTYLLDNLHTYTGSWFCYTSKTLSLIGNAHLGCHSLVIAVMKYVMIVRHSKVQSIGKDRMKRIFVAINIIYPVFVLAIFIMINPNFLYLLDSISQANRCLGKSDLYSEQNKTVIKMHHICKFSLPHSSWTFQNVFDLIKSVICWINLGIIYLNLWNILEAFVYFSIFRFMWRYEILEFLLKFLNNEI